MQGRQLMQQALFVTLNLEDFVPKEHKLRRIDRVLDLLFVSDLTKDLYCKGNGRPSIDPVVFFKMQIIKYLYNIDSDRQLCQDIHVNLAYRWFLRMSLEDKIPDHSALTKIRNRLGETIFESVFTEIVRQCQKAGLVKGKQLVTDGTLIDADASVDSIVERNPTPKDQEVAGKKPKKKKVSIETHVSTTDPDSSMVGRPGIRKRLYYKAHISADGSSRVITDCHVTTGATHECTIFKDRVDYQTEKFNLDPKEWLADAGYGHGPTYEFLKSKKITAYIPLRDKKLGRGKHAPTEGFEFNRKENTYTCPMGHKMYPNKNSNGFTRYVIREKKCVGCPMFETCFKDVKLKGRISKRIQRADHQDHFDSLHRRMPTPNFKKKWGERSWKIEGINAELKDNHGLRRANYRSRANVQIQVYLISTVFNLKCLAKTKETAKLIIILIRNFIFGEGFPNFEIFGAIDRKNSPKVAA